MLCLHARCAAEYIPPKEDSDKPSLVLPLAVGVGGGVGVLAVTLLTVYLVKRSKKNPANSKKVYVKDVESDSQSSSGPN